MNIGERIKHRRLALGLTLEDIANKLSVNVSTVSRYESTEIENMGIDKIGKLAKALSCSPAYLMGWEDQKSSGEPEDIRLYRALDPIDQAEVRGIMKQMLKAEKYQNSVFYQDVDNGDPAADPQEDFVIAARNGDGVSNVKLTRIEAEEKQRVIEEDFPELR